MGGASRSDFSLHVHDCPNTCTPDTICTIMPHLPQQSSTLKFLEHVILYLVHALKYYIPLSSCVWLTVICHLLSLLQEAFPDFHSSHGSDVLSSPKFQCLNSLQLPGTPPFPSRPMAAAAGEGTVPYQLPPQEVSNEAKGTECILFPFS